MELDAAVLIRRLNSILDSDPMMAHKLGISTDVVVTLHRKAKRGFVEAKKEYEVEDGAGGEEMEDDLMRHSWALVLLSSDFRTAWNSRLYGCIAGSYFYVGLDIFSTCHFPLPCNSENITSLNYGLGHFLDAELNLVSPCLVIPDNNFDDFEAQAIHSATYTLWLAKQLPRSVGVEFVQTLRAKNIATLVCKFCLNISFLEIIADTNQSETRGWN